MTENLKEDTLTSLWYNNDPSFESKRYGKLYKGTKIVSELYPLENNGWHIATKQDWENLVYFLGYNNELLDKICSTDYWTSPPYYNNLSGLDIVPSGIADSPSAFRLSGEAFTFYTRETGYYVFPSRSQGSTIGGGVGNTYYMSIRFCKTIS